MSQNATAIREDILAKLTPTSVITTETETIDDRITGLGLSTVTAVLVDGEIVADFIQDEGALLALVNGLRAEVNRLRPVSRAQAIVWAIGALRLAEFNETNVEAHRVTREDIALIVDAWPDLDRSEQHYPAESTHDEFWVTKLASRFQNVALLFTNEPPPALLTTFGDHLTENAGAYREPPV